MKRNLREFVSHNNGDTIESYGQVVREERFFCAVLFHLFLTDKCVLEQFLQLCRVPNIPNLQMDKVRMYVEYAMARDLWSEIDKRNSVEDANSLKKEIMINYVPDIIQVLSEKDIGEFNDKIVSGRRSDKYIQTPARWSVTKICDLAEELPEDRRKEEIEKAIKFKWAFNIKPDMVIELAGDWIICVEAKVESCEGKYPTDESDINALKKYFPDKRWSQTCIQAYLMKNILGYENCVPVFLETKEPKRHDEQERPTHPPQFIKWLDIFKNIPKDASYGDGDKFTNLSIETLRETNERLEAIIKGKNKCLQ